MVSEDWLKRLNQEFRERGIEQRLRPSRAIERYSTENKVCIEFSSQIAKDIRAWFRANSRSDAYQPGTLYKAVYFFDATFWTISIPVNFGTNKLDSLDMLTNMPENLKKELADNYSTAWDYSVHCADCLDYGLGIDEMRGKNLDKFGIQLLCAGDRELRAAVSLLKEPRPNPRAILSCRMAAELFLKSFIALKRGLTKSQAKLIGHDLKKVFDEFIEVSGYKHLRQLEQMLNVFPEIYERYNDQEIAIEKLWDGFRLAQSFGVLIVREFTNQTALSQVLPKSPKGLS